MTLVTCINSHIQHFDELRIYFTMIYMWLRLMLPCKSEALGEKLMTEHWNIQFQLYRWVFISKTKYPKHWKLDSHMVVGILQNSKNLLGNFLLKYLKWCTWKQPCYKRGERLLEVVSREREPGRSVTRIDWVKLTLSRVITEPHEVSLTHAANITSALPQVPILCTGRNMAAMILCLLTSNLWSEQHRCLCA